MITRSMNGMLLEEGRGMHMTDPEETLSAAIPEEDRQMAMKTNSLTTNALLPHNDAQELIIITVTIPTKYDGTRFGTLDHIGRHRHDDG